MNRYVVTVQRMPTNYHDPVSFVVEAKNEEDARAIVRDSLRDLAANPNFTYKVKDYVPPPPGRVITGGEP